MSYATIEDVKTLFRDFADNSEAAVDDNDIDLYLENTTSVINAKIGTVYQLPITETLHPESFAILKQIQMFKVAGIVDDILNNYSEADKKPMWDKKASTLLTALVPDIDRKTGRQYEAIMKLPDATYTGNSTQKGRMSINAISGTTFKKGADNW